MAKKRITAVMARKAAPVAQPRLSPRRVKIRISGSMENARKPAATSQTIVSRTSQRPMSNAETHRITATPTSVATAMKRRFGRPSGTSRAGPMEAIAD
jgi:hypothetical protein